MSLSTNFTSTFAPTAGYSVSLSWAPYLVDTSIKIGQTRISQVAWSHIKDFAMFNEDDFAPHHLITFSRTGSTKLVNSFLSNSVRKGSVADFMSQSDTLVLSQGTAEELLDGKLHATNSSHFISVIIHFESQPNEFWATTIDACMSFNESSRPCENWLDIIHAPLSLYECYFYGSGDPIGGPKIRLIPYSKTNNEIAAASGFVHLRLVDSSNDTGTEKMPQLYADKVEWNDSIVPAFITMSALAIIVVVAIIRMWPSSRRGYEVVP